MVNHCIAALAASSLSIALATGAAHAQSNLGFNTLHLDATASDDDRPAREAMVRLDIAITGHHGLQGDVGLADYDSGTVGYIGGHLYMVPTEGQKYGLFALVEDVDDEAVTSAQIGIEGLFSLGDHAVLDARAGLGRVDPSGLDYIFAGIGLDYALSDAVSVSGHLTVADYEETAFAARSAGLTLAARYAVPGSGAVLTAGLRHDRLTGRDGAPDETGAFLTVGWQIGGDNGARRGLRDRPFRPARPLDSLWRRDLVF